MGAVKCTFVMSCLSRVSRYAVHFDIVRSMVVKRKADLQQKFVAQLAMIPNLKIDYVVLNAGVLRYPNVSFNGHA
jgi:hypothetical protein